MLLFTWKMLDNLQNNFQQTTGKKFLNPFMVVPKWLKHLEVNLTKYVQNFHTDNYKPLLRKIKHDLNSGEIYHIHGL